MKNLDELFPGLHEHFVNFCRRGKDDLETLAHEGANPAIIIDILFPIAWFIQNPTKAGGILGIPWPAELRRLSSPSLWREGKAKLEKAVSFLSRLDPDYQVGNVIQTSGDARGENPLLTIFDLADEALERLKDLIVNIDALGLCEDGWEWKPGQHVASLVKTGKRGVDRSGRGRERPWAIFAALLQQHIKTRTGKAHWGTVVRLLHFAGFEQAFPVVTPREGERPSRDRSNELDDRDNAVGLAKTGTGRFLNNPVGRSVVVSILSDVEQKYEVVSDVSGRRLRTRLIMTMKLRNA